MAEMGERDEYFNEDGTSKELDPEQEPWSFGKMIRMFNDQIIDDGNTFPPEHTRKAKSYLKLR